jgi:plasmid replication initiation protein
MSLPRKPGPGDQFDLFLPYVVDLPLHDQREMMERPFFCLAKSKHVKPIDYVSPDSKVQVHVSANPDYGMATIWDADILIYCASVLADIARRGVTDVPRTLNLMPYDLLRAIGSQRRTAPTNFSPRRWTALSQRRSRPTYAPRTAVTRRSRGLMDGLSSSTKRLNDHAA